MKVRTSIVDEGLGQFFTASVFLGSAAMPCSDTTCPRYVMLCLKKAHFPGFNFTPANRSMSRTSRRYPRFVKTHCQDQDIVQVYTHFALLNQFPKELHHGSLKGGWSVAKPKRHHCKLP